MPIKLISADARNVSPANVPLQDAMERFVCYVRDRKEDSVEWRALVDDFKATLKPRKPAGVS